MLMELEILIANNVKQFTLTEMLVPWLQKSISTLL